MAEVVGDMTRGPVMPLRISCEICDKIRGMNCYLGEPVSQDKVFYVMRRYWLHETN